MSNLSALVTGGSRGIGRAIVEELAGSGVDVTFTYNSSEDAANQMAEDLSEANKFITVRALKADLSDADATSELCGLLQGDHYDVVIHNAGMSCDGLAASVDMAKAHKAMQLNYWSFVSLVKATLRPMIRKRSGRFIVISSIAGIQANKGNGIYASSKAALNAYVKAVAAEYGRKGVTANAVAPGFVHTDMIDSYKDHLKQLESANPSNRLARVEEISELVTYLATSKGSYVNGEVIAIDGGATNCL